MNTINIKRIITLVVLLTISGVAPTSKAAALTGDDRQPRSLLSGRSHLQAGFGNGAIFQEAAKTDGGSPVKSAVRLASSPVEPLSARVTRDQPERKAFQARISVSPQGNGFQSALLPIPAGKRLVIENISAIARCPEGFRMEINFFTYLDNNGDGVGDLADITFHRIALTDQGTFGDTAIASANHKVLVFADEQIGTSHFQVVVQARLNGSTTGFSQAQVTFSGYLEDLPTDK
jgi:hypothetical protein